MSAFGRDLVGNANCGTANPLMQMAGQMQGMGATLADVRSFSSVDKGGMLGPARPMQPDMMRPAMQTPETSHFLQQAPQGVFSPMGLPLHLQQQQQRPMPQMHGMPAGADLADQFMQMELQAKQKEEFERAFNAPHAGPSGADWAMEFQHKQQQQMQMQQQHRMMAAQRMGSAPMMNAGYDQMMMRSRMMGMPYMPSMMNQMHMPMHHMPPMTASSIPAPVAAAKQAPTATVVEQTDDLAEDNDVLEEAYKSVNSEEWASEFAQQEAMNNNGGGLGGGMDKDMLHKLMTSDNPKWRNSKFLKFIDKISKGEIEFRDNQAIERPAPAAQGEQWANEFTDTASSSAIPNWTDEFSISQNHPASWSDEFAQSGMMRPDAHLAEDQTEAERFMEEHGEELLNDGEFKDFDWAQALAKAKEDLPKQEDPKYKFQENNPHATKDSNQAFEEGVRLFKEGRIKESIVAFEACVTKQADHADAWAYLGEAQAQNEDEQNAISAFLQCVAIDPYNLKALLQLGISYTNDFEEHRALGYLKTWMQNNPAYHALSQQKQNVDEYLQFYGGDSKPEQYSYDNTLHDEVTKMFLNALTIRPDDADLHTVLGVLYHISSDFDKAIEAFKNAVKLKPDDAALWNKLGATLANSNKGADAVHAYKRALQLRPTFVRALANLAISFANQGLHQEAVQGYLATLAHNPEANHVWGYLRISLAYLKRDDLIELSHQKNVELFRPFFQF